MITQTEEELYVRIKPYYEFVKFVNTMPGMTELSSTIVLAETGVDMSIFDDASHLCSWCGLVPANNESAGKKKSTRIAKSGDYIAHDGSMHNRCNYLQISALLCTQIRKTK